MHPRLEDIRKRLQTPPVPSTPPRYTAPKRVVEVSLVREPSQEPPPVNDSAASANAYENLIASSSSQADPLIEQAAVVEQTVAKVDEQGALETPKLMDGLARAVAELFELAR